MNREELIEKWPGIAGADAAAVFGMDAWAMPVGYNGNDATLVLVRKGHAVAEGRLTRLGAQSAFAVEAVNPSTL